MQSLVIVESPAKAKTINKILGKSFEVKASIGHIKDLPKKSLGVDVNNNFEPVYEIIPGKEKIIKELKSSAKSASSIYIATDPDREGEAIAHHIATEINPSKQKPIYRVIFHEITEKAVLDAVKNPSQIDMHKVDAQQARRVLDRLVGYELSPFLWKKVKRGLSAGRVQSVAVRLIVDREREIQSFVKEEYWSITALLKAQSVPETEFQAELYKYSQKLVIDRDAKEGSRFLITSEAQAKEITEKLQNKELILTKVEKKLRKRSPAPPFITSTLQQEAARRLRFPAKKTMQIAQQLYEGVELEEGSVGLITYMRTDSYRISEDAQLWAKNYITTKFGKDYYPEKPNVYKSKGNVQDAHEAIRPTYENRPPEAVKKYLTKDQFNLYSLIWNRFIASQMSPALLEQTTFIISPKDSPDLAEFRASGSIVRFQGFMALYQEATDEVASPEDALLPDLKEGELLDVTKLEPHQHFTQPPPRYTEATLIKTLEEKGIGRPSTYATIISTIVDRKYVTKEENRFIPTELGMLVNDLLVQKFPELIDYQFTAKMEEELDEIENAKNQWVKVVSDFYLPFKKDLEDASKDTLKVKPKDIPTDIVCEKCGKPMVIKWGRHGRFLACTGFPECKNTKPYNNGQQPTKEEPIITDEKCDKCGSTMVIKNGRFGKFLACSSYPNCKNVKPLSTGVKCPEDGGDIIERKSKKGKTFWSCSNYPKCKFALWSKPIGQTCPKCGYSVLMVKKGKDNELYLHCVKPDCSYKERLQDNTEDTTSNAQQNLQPLKSEV